MALLRNGGGPFFRHALRAAVLLGNPGPVIFKSRAVMFDRPSVFCL